MFLTYCFRPPDCLDFVCLLFSGGQVIWWGFFFKSFSEENSCVQVESLMPTQWNYRPWNQNNRLKVGKNPLKSWGEMQIWVVIFCGFVTMSSSFQVTHSHFILCLYGNITADLNTQFVTLILCCNNEN